MRGLETSRLTLKPLCRDDAPALQAAFPRWEIVRQLADAVPWPYPADGAVTFLERILLPAIAAGRAWSWSLRLKSAPVELIGGIDLRLAQDDNRGFWLAPEHWGQGLMSEAAEAVTDFWFNELDQPLLRVAKAADNLASRRLSLRQGMRLVGRLKKRFVGGEREAELWEITREAWRRRSPSGPSRVAPVTGHAGRLGDNAR